MGPAPATGTAWRILGPLQLLTSYYRNLSWGPDLGNADFSHWTVWKPSVGNIGFENNTGLGSIWVTPVGDPE